MSDELKLKDNENKKLNEWNKEFILLLLVWSLQLKAPTWDLFHSPSKQIKWILLQIFVCENLAKFPPKIQPRIDFD
jgi:hypothetical protein